MGKSRGGGAQSSISQWVSCSCAHAELGQDTWCLGVWVGDNSRILSPNLRGEVGGDKEEWGGGPAPAEQLLSTLSSLTKLVGHRDQGPPSHSWSYGSQR